MIIKLRTDNGPRVRIISPEDLMTLVESFLEDPSMRGMEVDK